MSSSEVNLFDEKTMAFIEKFLTKVTVTFDKESNKFVVHWDTEEFFYMSIAEKEKVMAWLLWFWFMSLEKEKALEEQGKEKKSSYVS